MRGLWTQAAIGWVLVAALLPVAALLLLDGAGLRIAVPFAVACLWQGIFRLVQGVPLSPSGAVMAVALALLAPADLSLGQLALGASFGIVLAELVFGGWGRNVIAAPVAALAFLALSFPGLTAPTPEASLALASACGGVLLWLTGILVLRTVLAALATCLGGLALGGVAPVTAISSGALIFGLIFLLADPVASASTGVGRWLYGGLAGGLAALLALSGPGIATPTPIIFAALLAQIFAPLLDHFAIAILLARRTRRHG